MSEIFGIKNLNGLPYLFAYILKTLVSYKPWTITAGRSSFHRNVWKTHVFYWMGNCRYERSWNVSPVDKKHIENSIIRLNRQYLFIVIVIVGTPSFIKGEAVVQDALKVGWKGVVGEFCLETGVSEIGGTSRNGEWQCKTEYFTLTLNRDFPGVLSLVIFFL